MPRMRINVAQFVRDYHDAHTAHMSAKELAQVLGITPASLWSRVEQCRRRGIELPVLREGHRWAKRRRKPRTIQRAAIVSATPSTAVSLAADASPPVGFTFSVSYF
ncbi:MAG: winged helix-turn-helix domain-containing protein [Betaproteobacteria bacterium]|nr:winged helix-turn-helix domain-containing protein [Betaproteobacteria bacterium]